MTTSTAKRKIGSRDLFRFETVSDVQVHPDGSKLAWAQTLMDEGKGDYRSRVMWCCWNGSEPTPLTGGPGRDTKPQWSPDGKYLAFLSDRVPEDEVSGKDRVNQVWVIPTDGGEAWRLTDLKYGVKEFGWSPDGSSIALAAPIPPAGPAWENDPDEDEGDPYKKFNRDTRVITRIRYRWDGVGFFDEKRIHLAVMAFPAPGRPLHKPEFITEGDFNISSLTWSPQSNSIAFVSNLDPNRDFQRYQDVYVVDTKGGEPRKITTSLGPVSSPSWSPDGRFIAYCGHSQPRGDYSNPRLWIVGVEGEPPRCLTPDWEYMVGDASISDLRGSGPDTPVWSADGSSLFFLGSIRGRVHLFRVAAEGGTPQALTGGDRVVSGFSMSSCRDQVAMICLDTLSPGHVSVAEVGPELEEERILVSPNAGIMEELRLSMPERFTFTADGLDLDGWIIRPVDFDEGNKYPTVLQIHGGPQGMYGDCFFHEFQLLAAQGKAVVYSNPRGSLGYGEDFCAAIRGDWGNLDYLDVMACMDSALENFKFLDADRLGVAGGSYGGFMTNWIVTHTDRFKAGVTMRSVVNCYSGFGTSDIGYLEEEDMGGTPWERPSEYLRVSPISYVGNCRTPLMIIHSEHDFRCTIDEAEQLFVALKRLGVDTEYVRFSNESHGLSRGGKPWHRVFRLDKMVEWFDKYL